MVTKQDILQMVANPHDISAASIEKLKQLKNQYPYFSLLDMLLTKAYYDLDSLAYHEQLKKTAVSIPEREMLYLLIHEKKEEEVFQSTNETAIVDVKENQQQVSKLAVEVEKEEDADSLAIEEIAKEEKEKSKIEDLIKGKKDVLDELILSSAVGSYQLVDDSEEEAAEEKEPLEIEPETKVDENPVEVEQTPKNFFHWLTPTEEAGQDADFKKPSIDELVDKFLKDKDNERLSPKPFFSAEDKAKQSVKEDEDFVTETLANIYLKQKKYEKAKEAFQKLILKNPEKKPYFVDQIDQIDQLLNN